MKKETIIFSIASFLFGFVLGMVIMNASQKQTPRIVQNAPQTPQTSSQQPQQNQDNNDNVSLPPGHPDISKDYQTEIDQLKQSLQKSPDDVKTMTELARLYTQTRKFDEALPLYETIISLDATNIDALNGAANIYRINDDIEKAKILYEKVISIQQYDSTALLGLGWITLHIENNPVKTIEMWQLLLKHNPDFPYKDLLQQEIDNLKNKK